MCFFMYEMEIYGRNEYYIRRLFMHTIPSYIMLGSMEQRKCWNRTEPISLASRLSFIHIAVTGLSEAARTQCIYMTYYMRRHLTLRSRCRSHFLNLNVNICMLTFAALSFQAAVFKLKLGNVYLHMAVVLVCLFVSNPLLWGAVKMGFRGCSVEPICLMCFPS